VFALRWKERLLVLLGVPLLPPVGLTKYQSQIHIVFSKDLVVCVELSHATALRLALDHADMAAMSGALNELIGPISMSEDFVWEVVRVCSMHI